MVESWVVKNTTGGPLYLPGNKVRFNKAYQEKDLVFFTGKTVAQLEKDPEIHVYFKQKSLITIGEIVREEPTSVDNEALRRLQEEIQKQNITDQISELKDLLRTSQQGQKEPAPAPAAINVDELVSKIKDQIDVKITNITGENSDSVSYTEEEKMKEEALRKLVERDTKDVKSFKELGKKKQIEDEAGGNEDLLDF